MTITCTGLEDLVEVTPTYSNVMVRLDGSSINLLDFLSKMPRPEYSTSDHLSKDSIRDYTMRKSLAFDFLD